MGPAAAVTARHHARARSGWFDALPALVERLPIPAWLTYTVASLAVLAFMAAVAQANDREFGPGYALQALQVVMPVALGHHLTVVAREALRRFRSLLDVDDARFAEVEHDFLTLSPRATLTSTLAFGSLVVVAVVAAPEGLFDAYAGSKEALVLGIGPPFLLFGVVFGPFITRSLRQLIVISRLHDAARDVDPLRPGPTYAFSNFTVRMGLVMLLWGYAWLLADIQSGTEAAVAYLTDFVTMAIAAAFFVVPLWGMHRRLVTERDRLLDAADSRLERMIAELHRRADALDFRDADPLSKTIGSLISERDVILKAPTWPWRPGTLNTFISLLAAPIVLFVVTRILERFV